MQTIAILTQRVMTSLAFSGLALCLSAGLGSTQNLFSPVVRVDEKAITGYEISQRELLLGALRTPGNIEDIALQKLIDERLQVAAAQRANVAVDETEIAAGIEEFAGRANLSGEQLLSTLAAAGIAEESFRDFVVAGLAWRELVRGRFGPKAQVSESDIDRAIERAFERAGDRSTARVLISELFLPANTPQTARASADLAEGLARISSLGEFAAAARQYSIGPSRGRGGRVETWVPLTNLPPAIGNTFLTMKVGEVTNPFPLPEALVLFQLRALEEIAAPARKNVVDDYAAYYIAEGKSAAGQAAANKLATQVDRCDDLYGIAQGQPANVLQRDVLPVADIPQDVGIELAKLDVGEVSTALTRANGETLVFLMLCGRSSEADEAPSREAVQQRLFNQRISSYADNYLAELKAEAIITYP